MNENCFEIAEERAQGKIQKLLTNFEKGIKSANAFKELGRIVNQLVGQGAKANQIRRIETLLNNLQGEIPRDSYQYYLIGTILQKIYGKTRWVFPNPSSRNIKEIYKQQYTNDYLSGCSFPNLLCPGCTPYFIVLFPVLPTDTQIKPLLWAYDRMEDDTILMLLYKLYEQEEGVLIVAGSFDEQKTSIRSGLDNKRIFWSKEILLKEINRMGKKATELFEIVSVPLLNSNPHSPQEASYLQVESVVRVTVKLKRTQRKQMFYYQKKLKGQPILYSTYDSKGQTVLGEKIYERMMQENRRTNWISYHSGKHRYLPPPGEMQPKCQPIMPIPQIHKSVILNDSNIFKVYRRYLSLLDLPIFEHQIANTFQYHSILVCQEKPRILKRQGYCLQMPCQELQDRLIEVKPGFRRVYLAQHRQPEFAALEELGCGSIEVQNLTENTAIVLRSAIEKAEAKNYQNQFKKIFSEPFLEFTQQTQIKTGSRYILYRNATIRLTNQIDGNQKLQHKLKRAVWVFFIMHSDDRKPVMVRY